MPTHKNLDYEKITQVLNFFATKAGGTINRMKALKLMFLADRYHLRKYARLVSNDRYVAMKLGPIPSLALDIAEGDTQLPDTVQEHANKYVAPVNQYNYKSVEPVDYDVFSETDIEALEFSWSNFGNLNQWDISDFTHNYPEWEKHKRRIDRGANSVPMSLDDFFNEPNSPINKCYELDDEAKAIRREILAEAEHIESLWR